MKSAVYNNVYIFIIVYEEILQNKDKYVHVYTMNFVIVLDEALNINSTTFKCLTLLRWSKASYYSFLF